MSITGPGSVGGSAPLSRLQPSQQIQPQQPTQPAQTADSLEISEAGRMLEETNTSGVRAERLARIKAEIEAGTYETPQKLEAAVSRMLDEIGD